MTEKQITFINSFIICDWEFQIKTMEYIFNTFCENYFENKRYICNKDIEVKNIFGYKETTY